MKKLKALFFSIFIVMLLVTVGCKSHQPTLQAVHDSIYVERTKTITVTDTVFKTAASQVSLSIPCDSLKPGAIPVSKSVNNARLTVHRQGGYLKIDCKCDTLAIKAHLLHTMETEHTARSKLQHNVTILEVKYVPPLIKFLAWSGGIAWLLLILFIVYKVFIK